MVNSEEAYLNLVKLLDENAVEYKLFSPVLPTKTIQAKGADLKKVFDNLENKVVEVTVFNLA